MNLINKTFISEKGKKVRVQVTFSGGVFQMHIDVNHELICRNDTYSPYLREDQIYPELTNEDRISEINSELIKVASLIRDSIKKSEE